ncbi:DUF6414 family protein [Lysinibacillus sp. 3P01SB]|uniref:DUF6414 family protein n=1 Tax=Lysinibacillus sp. 3P01SB TaxID=3132284 RepID=UPI0039A7866A
MKKIIYFDESSALDLIDIKNEGRSNKLIDTIVSKAGKFGVEGAIGTGWLDNLTTGFTGGIKAGFSRKKTSIIQTNITNTILTSFLEIIKNPEGKEKEIQLKKIKTKNIYIFKESAAYIKSIAPFIKILKEDKIDNKDLESIHFHEMDAILELAKGYYELLSIDNEDKKTIVRFNLEGFRNNYRLQDLQKMELVLYGVVVGKAREASLSFINEIEPEEKQKKNDKGFDAFADTKESDEDDLLEIIDIILAGVE